MSHPGLVWNMNLSEAREIEGNRVNKWPVKCLEIYFR